ncbi:ABC transporter permease [Nakamurella endophytica]|uniref:ABC transporter permease n=1 Tax=Nakamurella endophytica TaxID=1748367 RepID=UPI001E58CB62|nr:ABC transporter permease subunit [Nakamurella endophytica]
MPTTATPAPDGPSRSVAADVLRRVGVSLLTFVVSAVVLVLLWYAFLSVFRIDSFVGKRPVDVWRYLFDVPAAAKNRSALLSGLGITLSDAAIGFVSGTVLAVLVAVLFTLVRPLEFAFLPLAMLLRSVPLVAMAPLIGLVFGRGIAGAAAIGGIVVFFPVLVNVSLGLRSASQQSLDVVRVNGGSRWTALRMVAVPSALPNLFAALRISVPGAVIGAMLYEWLFSAKGLGAAIFRANAQVQYNLVWAIVVVVTGASIALYTVVGIVETVVLSAWGPSAGRR